MMTMKDGYGNDGDGNDDVDGDDYDDGNDDDADDTDDGDDDADDGNECVDDDDDDDDFGKSILKRTAGPEPRHPTTSLQPITTEANLVGVFLLMAPRPSKLPSGLLST